MPRKLRPQWVLLAGFGGLLGFLLAAALGTLILLDRVSNLDRRTRQSSIERLAALEQIRSQIYLSGTYVRDYLLSPDPAGAAAQRGRLNATETESRNLLARYAASIDPEEQGAFDALRSEISAYWQVLQTTFDWTPAQRDELRYPFFYEQLVPRRTTMLRIADSIEAINQKALARAEAAFTASAGNLRWSLIATFGIALFGGLLLAVAAIVFTLRLERQLDQRSNDMQELSARVLRIQEEERRHLARELHDEVGQSLTAILMEAGNIEVADPAVHSIAAIATKTLNAVRDLALLLRPSMLDDFGLVPALNWHVRETAKRTGLNIRIAADDSCDELPEEHKTCIYRLVQEALNNSARHASARSVSITVHNEGDRVRFAVRDDGTGFEKKQVRGLGLLGMEERVRRLGGTLRIDTQPGRGTTVSAELPLADLHAPEANAEHTHSAG